MADRRKADIFAGKGSVAGALACRRKAMERGDVEAAAECMRRGGEIMRDGTTPDRTKPVAKVKNRR